MASGQFEPRVKRTYRLLRHFYGQDYCAFNHISWKFVAKGTPCGGEGGFQEGFAQFYRLALGNAKERPLKFLAACLHA